MSKTAGPRPYHSPTRTQRAFATRQAIAEAAASLFASQGYRATTIKAIAEHAGFAPQTLYATFGSKRGILLELVAQAKAAADVSGTYVELMEEPDPARQLALTVDITERWGRASAGLVELVRVEAGSDPEVDSAWAVIEQDRLDGVRAFVSQLHARGQLRAGLTVDTATDLVWALESTDVHRLLVTERGWSARKYRQHVTALLVQALLNAPA